MESREKGVSRGVPFFPEWDSIEFDFEGWEAKAESPRVTWFPDIGHDDRVGWQGIRAGYSPTMRPKVSPSLEQRWRLIAEELRSSREWNKQFKVSLKGVEPVLYLEAIGKKGDEEDAGESVNGTEGA